ncbi:hypothetical protein C0993_009096 [Termitomyces sp. T159_Od127]|nr:hypothetical protein C0993_009096 [Termitomyces sp. T159_Od127]
MYKRYNDGVSEQELGPPNYTDILSLARLLKLAIQDGFKGWGKMVFRDGWKYFILAAFDVEGNFLVVKVVGQLGMWGTLINGIQAAGLEHGAMKLASWNRMTSA